MTQENLYSTPLAKLEQVNPAASLPAREDWQRVWFHRTFWAAFVLWLSFLAIVVTRQRGFLHDIANYLAWSSWIIGAVHLYLLTRMAARVGESPGKWVAVVVFIPLGYLFSYLRIRRSLRLMLTVEMPARSAEDEAKLKEQRRSTLLASKALLFFLALFGLSALIVRFL